MPRSRAKEFIDETEVIFNRFGMDAPVYPTNIPEAVGIRKNAKWWGIDLLIIKQKHLGSDKLPDYIKAMADHVRFRGAWCTPPSRSGTSS